MTMAEGWTKDWERRIVNGVYPLRRFLGQSDHSVVFLTDYKGQNIVRAAIKILPANPTLAEAQLAHWRTTATLSHPHLIRLLDSGRCQLGGHDFLFVVTDYAEQNLSQILPSRALTALEVKELLPPTLDTLSYLHGQNLVHGGLKPSNFLVVHDQLKLASDTIRPAGESPGVVAASLYDPPEAANGMMSAAGDLWGLGITLAESLTQTAPTWSRENSESPSLPRNFAPALVDTVRRCLNRDPDQRPTVAELVAQLKEPPPAMAAAAPMLTAVTAAAVTGAAVPATPAPAAAVRNPPSLRTLVTGISPRTRSFILAGALGVLAAWAIWTGARSIRAHVQAPPLTSAPAASSPIPPPPVERPTSNALPLPAVVHQELPDVPRSARDSVRGVIKIAVRVSVDRSGNVVAASLEHRASSRYFDRAATQAAMKWKFAPAPDGSPRAWVLHFEFTRAGTTARAVASR